MTWEPSKHWHENLSGVGWTLFVVGMIVIIFAVMLSHAGWLVSIILIGLSATGWYEFLAQFFHRRK